MIVVAGGPVSHSSAPRPQGQIIRQLRFGADLSVLTDMHNTTVTREWNFTLGEISTHAGDNVGLSLTPTYELLESMDLEPLWVRGLGTRKGALIGSVAVLSWGSCTDC